MADKLDLEAFKDELRELLTKYHVGIGVEIEGDTHGLRYDFTVTDLRNGLDEYIIADCVNYIDFSDF